MKNHLKALIDTASGRRPADLEIRNATVVDVFGSCTFQSSVFITDGCFAGFGGDGFPGARHVVDAKGMYMMPGFIDSHVHIESSECSPEEFCKLVIPHGTTTVVADPHEICNVCGLDGLDYMLEASEGLPLDVKLMVPSCVPCTPFEHSGAVLRADSIAKRIGNDRVLGLGELMDYPGTANADSDILDKLVVAKRAGKFIDGHSCGCKGAVLDAYVASGARADHECENAEEALDRVRRGMCVMLRQGTVCHNVKNLVPAVTSANSRMFVFCTDDRQARSLLVDGSVNHAARTAVENGLDPLVAISIATINAARLFSMNDRGAIAPGLRADFMLCEKLDDFRPSEVYVKGVKVAQGGEYLAKTESVVPKNVSGRVNIGSFSREKLGLHIGGSKARVMGIVPGGVVTDSLVDKVICDSAGFWQHDPSKDILKIAVVERHKGTGNVGVGLVKGYGLRHGAVATTVAHDSHNMIVVGDNDEDMALAVFELEHLGGGMTCVQDGKVLGSLALPIAGLMTPIGGKALDGKLEKLHETAYATLGVNKAIDPFMTLCFMALIVIPSLKITDSGLFDVPSFNFVPVKA